MRQTERMSSPGWTPPHAARPLTIAAFACVVNACTGTPGIRASALPFIRSAAMTPEWLSPREANAPTTHHIAAFRMTDQGGRTITDTILTGKITVAHFFFTQCGDVCPITTRNIATLLTQLPDSAIARLQVLSYSLTPEHDSVAALHRYARIRGITDPRWHLLTGTREQVERLARESYFVGLGDGKAYGVANVAHTESLVLLDGHGRLRGIYAGTLPLDIQRLEEDIRTLARED